MELAVCGGKRGLAFISLAPPASTQPASVIYEPLKWGQSYYHQAEQSKRPAADIRQPRNVYLPACRRFAWLHHKIFYASLKIFEQPLRWLRHIRQAVFGNWHLQLQLMTLTVVLFGAHIIHRAQNVKLLYGVNIIYKFQFKCRTFNMTVRWL